MNLHVLACAPMSKPRNLASPGYEVSRSPGADRCFNGGDEINQAQQMTRPETAVAHSAARPLVIDGAAVQIAIRALELLQGRGVPAVNERLRYLNARVWSEAERRGLTGPSPGLRAPHIAVVELGARHRHDLARELRQHKTLVTIRGTKMRVTPHVYNEERDVVRLFDVLEQLTS